jgi:hypothetical protein
LENIRLTLGNQCIQEKEKPRSLPDEKSRVSQEKEELHRKSQEEGGTRVPHDEQEPGSPRRRRKQGSPGGGEMLGFPLKRSSQSPTRMKKNQGCQGGKTYVVRQEDENPGSSGRR